MRGAWSVAVCGLSPNQVYDLNLSADRILKEKKSNNPVISTGLKNVILGDEITERNSRRVDKIYDL